MKYIETVKIERSEYDRINRLLAIDDFESWTDEDLRAAGARYVPGCEGIFFVTFADGSTMSYDLCSGQHNFFDDVVWTSADGTHEDVILCEFELDDIEVEIEGVVYGVKLEIVN